MLHPVLEFLLPTDCFGCALPVDALQRHGACSSCWATLRPIAPPFCSGCGLPRPACTDLLGPAAGRCANCTLRPPVLKDVRAAVVYDRLARAFLLRAKLGRRTELFRPMADMLAAALAQRDPVDEIAVPVPSHPWPSLLRGFSPGAEIARRVARVRGIPLDRLLLRRRWRSARSIKRLSARQRALDVSGNLTCTRPVRGARVLLIDDVMTTGASLEACARALRTAGAEWVRAAVWARTPP